MSIRGDNFESATFGFRLQKPSDWTFLPTAWAVANRRKVADEELFELFARSAAPFVCAQYDTRRSDHVLPTFQVTARRIGEPLDPQALLQAQRDMLVRAFDPEFELETTDAIVAGHSAVLVQTVAAVATDTGQVMEFRSRVYVVVHLPWAFTIGLSSSTDPAVAHSEALFGILSTVRIE